MQEDYIKDHCKWAIYFWGNQKVKLYFVVRVYSPGIQQFWVELFDLLHYVYSSITPQVQFVLWGTTIPVKPQMTLSLTIRLYEYILALLRQLSVKLKRPIQYILEKLPATSWSATYTAVSQEKECGTHRRGQWAVRLPASCRGPGLRQTTQPTGGNGPESPIAHLPHRRTSGEGKQEWDRAEERKRRGEGKENVN